MKALKLIAILIFFLFNTPKAWACKDQFYSKNYPLELCKKYDYVLVVKIDHSKHSDSLMYNPLLKFEGTVIQSFKGNLEIGDTIAGKHKKEVARAVCPVRLEQGATYLLLLSENKNGFLVSRFSYPVKNSNQYFNQYIKQIKTAYPKE